MLNGIQISHHMQEIEISGGKEFELQVVSFLSNLNDLLLLARLRLYFSAQKDTKAWRDEAEWTCVPHK